MLMHEPLVLQWFDYFVSLQDPFAYYLTRIDHVTAMTVRVGSDSFQLVWPV